MNGLAAELVLLIEMINLACMNDCKVIYTDFPIKCVKGNFIENASHRSRINQANPSVRECQRTSGQPADYASQPPAAPSAFQQR